MEKNTQLTVLVFIAATIVAGSAILPGAYAQDKTVPGWIKNMAKSWYDGGITDGEFLNAVKYLIENRVIQIKEFWELKC